MSWLLTNEHAHKWQGSTLMPTCSICGIKMGQMSLNDFYLLITMEKLIKKLEDEVSSVEDGGEEEDFEEGDIDWSLGYIDGINFAIRKINELI